MEKAVTDLVKHIEFTDTEGDMPEVHRDHRRKISEAIHMVGGTMDRRTRIEVSAAGLPLGNHWHSFTERFSGRGRGRVILIPPGATVGDDLSEFTHELPAEGWEVTVPPRTAHTFVFDGESDADGVIAVLLSYTDQKFVKDENTFDYVLVEPTPAA